MFEDEYPWLSRKFQKATNEVKQDGMRQLDAEIFRDIELDARQRLPGRALTLEDKQRVIDAVLRAWVKHSSQRLGQLIYNASRKTDLFDVEDDVLIKAIEEFVK